MAKTNSHQNITKVSEYRPPSPPYLENIPKKTIFLECFLKRPDDPKVSGWSAKCPTNPKSVLIISNMSWQKRLHNYGILQSKIGEHELSLEKRENMENMEDMEKTENITTKIENSLYMTQNKMTQNTVLRHL